MGVAKSILADAIRNFETSRAQLDAANTKIIEAKLAVRNVLVSGYALPDLNAAHAAAEHAQNNIEATHARINAATQFVRDAQGSV